MWPWIFVHSWSRIFPLSLYLWMATIHRAQLTFCFLLGVFHFLSSVIANNLFTSWFVTYSKFQIFGEQRLLFSTPSPYAVGLNNPISRRSKYTRGIMEQINTSFMPLQTLFYYLNYFAFSPLSAEFKWPMAKSKRSLIYLEVNSVNVKNT